MIGRIAILLSLALLLASPACEHHQKAQKRTTATKTQTGDVHTIALPHYQATLPEAPGREAFAVACLSCHSTRYITTQPPLSLAKWEESVRKMIKTYAAPIGENEVTPIATYIVAARKENPGSWESLAGEGRWPEAAAGWNSSAPAIGDPKRGDKLYATNCASCHGADGRSQTVAAAALLPRPTDLTTGRFAPTVVEASIVRGVRGTGMPAAAPMSKQELADLVAFTLSLAGSDRPQTAAVVSDPAEAKALFVRNCAQCHGVDGSGNGDSSAPLARRPGDFRLRQPGADHAARVIADGIAGSAMPAWRTKLSEPQRLLLAQYVRSLYAAQSNADAPMKPSP
jgi:mono/diheme cytochrome c family protein